jgi:hypothetical protein
MPTNSQDDEVLFAYATQDKTINFLKLTGPDWSGEEWPGEGIPIILPCYVFAEAGTHKLINFALRMDP